MSEKKIFEKLREQAEELRDVEPEDAACFMFKEGRYYLAMWFANLPIGFRVPNAPMHMEELIHNEGDITLLVWRKDAEPTHWHVRYRFRYYRSAGAWDGKDIKRWYKVEANLTEAEMFEGIEKFFQDVAALGGKLGATLKICGDDMKFFKEMQRQQPEWMHMKFMKVDK